MVCASFHDRLCKSTTLVKALFLATTVAGCASDPDSLGTQHVSEVRYTDWSCKQLAAEATSIDNRISELHGQLKRKADNDSAQMAIGLILFWPTLFLLEGGDGPQAAEFSRLKGERTAIDRTARFKRCDAVPMMKLPSASQQDALRELQVLREELNSGKITQDEYDTKKMEIAKRL